MLGLDQVQMEESAPAVGLGHINSLIERMGGELAETDMQEHLERSNSELLEMHNKSNV